ncbi:hypothetical protein Dimus_036422, partial [Dionaea muscipula]
EIDRSNKEGLPVSDNGENVRVEYEDPEVEILSEVQGQPQRQGIGSRVSTRRRKSCRGYPQTVNTRSIANEEAVRTQSGPEPDSEDNDSEIGPVFETPITEEESSDDGLLLKDMLDEAKKNLKRKRQSKTRVWWLGKGATRRRDPVMDAEPVPVEMDEEIS